jgi:hypothetical protein
VKRTGKGRGKTRFPLQGNGKNRDKPNEGHKGERKRDCKFNEKQSLECHHE